jgi:hypothetical protein
MMSDGGPVRFKLSSILGFPKICASTTCAALVIAMEAISRSQRIPLASSSV